MAPVGASRRPPRLVATPSRLLNLGYSLSVHPCLTPADPLRQLFRTLEMDIERVCSLTAGAWPGVALRSLAASAVPRPSYGLARVGCCRQRASMQCWSHRDKNLAAISQRTPHLAAVRVACGRSGGCGDGSRRQHSAAPRRAGASDVTRQRSRRLLSHPRVTLPAAGRGSPSLTHTTPLPAQTARSPAPLPPQNNSRG